MTVRLDHVNLTVPDLNESIEWYKKIFGFELVESGISPRGLKWGIIAHNDSMLCMTEYGHKRPAHKNEDDSTHRIFHFGIRVSDLDEWQQTVKENQLKLYYGGVIEYPSSKSWYIHDPSGHEIEVSYTAQERIQFPSQGARYSY